MANLEAEVATYASKLSELSAQAGKFVLIKQNSVVGVYDTYADALKVGYERFGLEPFLVKQIAPTETVLHFTRDFQDACH